MWPLWMFIYYRKFNLISLSTIKLNRSKNTKDMRENGKNIKIAKNLVKKNCLTDMVVLYLIILYINGNVDKKFQPSIFYRSRENYVSSTLSLTDRRTDISIYRVASLLKSSKTRISVVCSTDEFLLLKFKIQGKLFKVIIFRSWFWRCFAYNTLFFLIVLEIIITNHISNIYRHHRLKF